MAPYKNGATEGYQTPRHQELCLTERGKQLKHTASESQIPTKQNVQHHRHANVLAGTTAAAIDIISARPERDERVSERFQKQ